MHSNNAFYLLLNFLFYSSLREQHACLTHFCSLDSFSTQFESYLQQKNYSFEKKTLLRKLFDQFDFDSICRTYQQDGTQILFYDDPAYPPLLKEISYPPLVLYCKGALSLLQETCFSIVGNRAYSDYGKQVTEQFSSALAAHFVIVSGMAEGIDTIAHHAAIRSQKRTIAVLGTPLNKVYPASNVSLFHRLCRDHLVISEFPLHAKGSPRHFPQRNRIVTGLSCGLLVSEARLKSGSLISAQLACEQNRDVFAIPGSIFSKHQTGVHSLIQDGAKLVHCPGDILVDYDITPILNSDSCATPPSSVSLDEQDQLIFTLLQSQDYHLDDLIEKTNLPVNLLLQKLSFLECHGLIRAGVDQFFSIQSRP